MSEDTIRKYLDAKKELDKTFSKVKALNSVITHVAEGLNEPFKFMVSNINIKDVGFPPEVAMARGIPTLNADEWPSAEDIAKTLSELHKKYHQVMNLWHSLPRPDQSNLTPPPPR